MKKDYNLDDCPKATEYVAFLMLSGEEGEKFLDIPKRKRTDEQYARLIAITFVFDFRNTFFTLVNEAGNRIRTILDYLLRQDYLTIESWITQAVENVPIVEIKEMSRRHWENKISRIDKNDFDIRKLFGPAKMIDC